MTERTRNRVYPATIPGPNVSHIRVPARLILCTSCSSVGSGYESSSVHPNSNRASAMLSSEYPAINANRLTRVGDAVESISAVNSESFNSPSFVPSTYTSDGQRKEKRGGDGPHVRTQVYSILARSKLTVGLCNRYCIRCFG